MKEELFNYTLRKYHVSEYLDTNPIRPPKQDVNIDFWDEIVYSVNNVSENHYTPWGEFTYKGVCDTEEKFVEHYGNPFAHLNFNRIIVCVTKEDNKVSFKVFSYSKNRRLAGKWFKIHTSCKFITFNHKTNALYTGSLTNYHLKRKCRKKLSRILFDKDPINSIRRYLRESFSNVVSDDSVDIATMINQVITTFVDAIPGTEKYPNLLPEQKFYKRYLDAQGTKIPNNWFELMTTYPQPKKKDLVKCGYKYIDALMSVHNLKGEKVKRVLHNVKSFYNSNNFTNACEIFGDKFILNQSDEFIQTLLENGRQLFNRGVGIKLSKSEMSNFFEIYKLFHKKVVDYNVIQDHFRFYNLLKEMEPVRWLSRTQDEFVQEHYDWSEKYSHYTNGDFNRIYNQRFVDKVNEVILTKDGPYFPEVLITSKRYNNESLFQSNCVKTYIKRIGSLLISIRRGEGDTEERASIEFEIIPLVFPDEMYFNLRRVQTLGKRNERLDSSWDDVLNKLDERIDFIVNEKMFDTLQIDGEFRNRKIFSDYAIKGYSRTGSNGVTSIKEGVYLEWENSSIMKLNSYNYIVEPIDDDEDIFGF